MSMHNLKCWPQFFDAIIEGRKRFELRRADDRDFHVGDVLRLREFDPKSGIYTNREATVRVDYIVDANMACALSPSALHEDFCIMSISLEEPCRKE